MDKKLFENLNEETISQKLVSKKKVDKWAGFGLLEGLKGRKRIEMACLLENEAKWLLREASNVSDIKGFQAIAFPLVRRVFGALLAQEICSVQPMALPAGLLFWLDFQFGTGNKAGVGTDAWVAGGSVFGQPTAPLTGGQNAKGGHYYLHNSYTQFEASASVGIAASGTVTWAQVDYDPELSAAVASPGLFYAEVDLDENVLITNVDTTNFKSFAISGAQHAARVNETYRRHNSLDTTTNVLRVIYSGSLRLDSGSAVQVAYVKKDALSADTTGTTATPAFEYAFDGSDNIPELDIKIASIAVQTNTRKLKVKWSPELAQDLNAYHTLDAEQELTQVIADQMALDIDSEIVRDMLNNAKAGTFFWDRRPGFFVDRDTGAPVAGPSYTGNTVDWYRTLLETVVDLSNTIHRKTLIGGANFIVTSPDVCTILENIVQWRPNMDFEDVSMTKFSMGVEKVGSLANRFTVYKAPFMYRNVMLVGHKGTRWLDTGYVYGPYVPMIVTPTIYEPNNFTPTKAVMTRYAKQIINGAFFGRVIVKGMGIF